MMLDVEILKLMDDISNIKDFDDSYSFLTMLEEDSRFTQVSSLKYFYKGYMIENMLQVYSEVYVQKLKFINTLEITSAPKFIDYIKCGQGESFIITFLPGCEDSLPLPYSQFSENVTDVAKKIFLDDMRKLSTYKVIHSYAAKDYNYWTVRSKDGHILLKDWECLSRIENDTELQEMIKSIEEKLYNNVKI
ncbi:hypothetical protein [Clostridium manihotivorum]|uniref:Uncharacterized protein n=1 Tax=Clostridium manihotivorum TaxID=2320868 RepID=A0A3R5UFM1_9CLOT|nr:hypothetical protein [Clostridium manihotivorum]QAA32514.1 hypothetical protein C1I91_13215 [Clostridium manihotivorum]